MLKKYWSFPFIFFLLWSCRTIDESIIPYDPPGATTETQELDKQHKRIIGAGSPMVFIYNEFDGARYSDFYHVNEDTFAVVIAPENTPINNSAWYAFHLWSEEEQVITLRLLYEDGEHRYHPKFRYAHDTDWLPVEENFYRVDDDQGTAEIDLFIDPEGITISAQELITNNIIKGWINEWEEHPSVTRSVIGMTHQDRAIEKMYFADHDVHEHLLLVFGRQHPPEVPGSLAMKAFLDRILEDDDLATEFRSFATVVSFPLMNPDGVAGGHWRHNGGGVDLNRDWVDFNQPETRAFRNHILRLMEDPDARIYYGMDFHSTNRDVFFTVDKQLPSWPENFADNWISGIQLRLPDYELSEEPFGVAPPIVKNWIYNTFRSGAVTYEVGDNTDRELLKDVARAAAESAMEEMIRVYNEEF